MSPSWPLVTIEVFDLIRSRRSFRRFAPTPLFAAQLQQLGEDLATFAQGVPLDSGLLWQLLVFKAAAMKPGIYTWKGSWVLEKRGNFQKALYRVFPGTFGQGRCGDGLVTRRPWRPLWGCGDFEWAFSMQVWPGSLSIWLRGAKACGVGAFADDELQSLLGGKEGVWPVDMVAFGQKS